MVLAESTSSQEEPNQVELRVTGSCSYGDWQRSVTKLVDRFRFDREVVNAQATVRGEFIEHKIARHDSNGEVKARLSLADYIS